MSSVRIPPVLREEVGGQRVVEATGGSVSEVLDQLFAAYPRWALASPRPGSCRRS